MKPFWPPPRPHENNCFRLRAYTKDGSFILGGQHVDRREAVRRCHDLATDILRHERFLEIRGGGVLRSSAIYAITPVGYYDAELEKSDEA